MNSIRPPVLTVDDVSKSFGRGATAVRALDRCSLSVEPGELVALTGRSGSGKTTLASVILGWVRPDTGSVKVETADRPIDVAVVPQELGLYEELNAGENATVARLFSDVGDHWHSTLEVLGVSDLQTRRPDELSLGEQQRIAVARALITDAAVIIADEPTSHQDEENSDAIVGMLSAAADRGAAVLLTTHDPRIVAYCDRTIKMSDGRLANSVRTPSEPSTEIDSVRHWRPQTAEIMMLLAVVAVAAALVFTVVASREAGAVDSNEETTIGPGDKSTAIDYGSVIDTKVDSAALGQSRRLLVFLPPGYTSAEGSFATLYLLHEQREGPQMFQRLGVFRRAAELMNRGEIAPMVLVAPDIGNSFGVNNSDSEVVELGGGVTIEYDGDRYEDFLADDLPSFIEETYNVSTDRADRYVGGISMGGFAALHLGLRHPNLYSKVGGHTPALVDDGFTWLYPSDQVAVTRNPVRLAAAADLSGTQYFVDAGEDDESGFDDAAIELADELGGAESMTFSVWPGRPGDTYWRQHVDTYLRFYGT
jgi:ABC-type lipoprotein export system ATPase subunit/enterochelin esterase-like enzyme